MYFINTDDFIRVFYYSYNVIISYIEVMTMNKILILYKSKYGATKKYAYMLKKRNSL